MALITKSRRNLMLIIAFAIIGIFAIRQTGKAALHKAITVYTSEAGSVIASSYAPVKVDKRLNMAPWLRAGVQLIDMEGEERGFLRELIRKNPQQLDDPTRKSIEKLIQRNEFPIQILNKAVPLQQSSLDLRYEAGMEMELPNLLEYLQGSLLIGAKWRLDMQTQDLAAATQTALIQERIASALTHEPLAIAGLIGHVAERDFHEFIHRTINATEVSKLEMELEYLNHLKAMAAPLDRVIAADGAMIYSSLSSQFLREDHLENQLLPASQRIFMRTSYIFNRSYFLANLLGTYTDFLQYARRPATQEGKNSIDQTWVAKLFFLSDSFVGRYQAQDASRNLAIAAVTLRLNALRKGFFEKPVSLPKSLFTGETAEYRSLPDESVEISFPQTIKMWDQRFPQSPPEKPRFLWKLKPL